MGLFDALPDVVGGVLTKISTDDANTRNERFQKDMRRTYFQDLAHSAEKAGISKLAALGAQVTGGQPSAVGMDFGDVAHRMGQDLSRSSAQTMTPLERAQESLILQQRKGQELENEAKAIALAKLRSDQVAPATPEIQSEGTYSVAPDGRSFSINPRAQGVLSLWQGILGRAIQDPNRMLRVPPGAPRPPAGMHWEYSPSTFQWEAVGPGPNSQDDRRGMEQYDRR